MERRMAMLTEYTRYADAQLEFSTAQLWALFDGDRERLNIAHECIDRHAGDASRFAVRIAHADGADEILTFREIAGRRRNSPIGLRRAASRRATASPSCWSHRARLRNAVRGDETRRHRRAAVHAVRDGGAAPQAR